MRKKIRVFLILFVVLIIGGCLPENKANTSMADDHTNSQATGKTRHEMIYVKGEGFESLEEMEEASECIVRVKKESEDEPVVSSDHGTTGYTMSHVRIQEVFYNTLGDKIQNDQIIDIWEGEFPDGNVIAHIAGYEKMEIGKEYILFLRRSTSHDCFLSLGVIYGKVSVVEEEESEFIQRHPLDDTVKKVLAQAREKYVKQ